MNSIGRVLSAVVLITSFYIVPVMTSQSGCPEHFADGQAPDLESQKLTTKSREVCYSGYPIVDVQ